jgi:hypothetical protein
MRRPQLKKNQTALVPGIIQLKIILRWKTDGFRAALPRKARSSAEDLFSAAGLPLRASVGFLVYPALQEKRRSTVDVGSRLVGRPITNPK